MSLPAAPPEPPDVAFTCAAEHGGDAGDGVAGAESGPNGGGDVAGRSTHGTTALTAVPGVLLFPLRGAPRPASFAVDAAALSAPLPDGRELLRRCGSVTATAAAPTVLTTATTAMIVRSRCTRVLRVGSGDQCAGPLGVMPVRRLGGRRGCTLPQTPSED